MLTQIGVRNKPVECKLCPQHYIGTGFCPDFVSAEPKLLLICASPTSDDVIMQAPLSGGAGLFFENKVLKPAGLKREELAIAHVLRCGCRDYPIGKIKKQAESNCRQYDSVIKKFNPSLFVITFSIEDTFSDQAYVSLLINDMKRAVRLTQNYPDEKVCVLLGREVVQMVNELPFRDGKGGLKSWRGSWFKGVWNY
jgi:hypothetical protein